MSVIPINNRRNLNRIEPPVATQVVLHSLSRRWTVKVLDAHPLGMRVALDESFLKFREKDQGSNCQLEVTPGFISDINICHITNSEKSKYLGLTYKKSDKSAPQNLSFTHTDSEWDYVDNQEDLESLVSDLVRRGPETILSFKQQGRTSKVFVRSQNEDGSLVLERLSDERRQVQWKTGSVHLRFELYQCCYVIMTEIERIDGQTAIVRKPKSMVRLLRRQTMRTPVGVDRQVYATFNDLFLSSDSHRFKVMDISETGVLLLDQDSRLFAPVGSNLSDFTVHHASAKISGNAQIMSARRFGDGQLIGVSFNVSSEQERHVWHDLILNLRYPQLDFNYTDADHGRIWNLFERSGYVGHLDQASAEDQLKEPRQASQTSWKALQESGVLNSRRLLHRNEDQVVGHLQMDRYYNDTWCVHHLAIDKTVSKVIAKELYGAVTDILSTENAKYLISYHRPDLSWNQRNYYEFIEKYPFSAHHNMQLFHLYDVDFSKLQNSELPPSVQVRRADRWDLKRIFRFFELQFSPLVREALSVAGEDLVLGDLGRELGRFGLERGRDFVVATDGGRLLAFAQVEWGSPGVNVFRLFDSVFLHTLEPQPAGVISALLNAAFEIQKERGKTRALLFLKDGQVPVVIPSGYHYLCDEVRWIANCVATRRYQAYSQTLFGKLLSRRSVRKPK